MITDHPVKAMTPATCPMPATSGEHYRLLEQLEAVWRGRIDRIGQILANEHTGGPTRDRHKLPQGPETLTMTMTTELDASVGRAWQLWADPRQLELWWGPPTYPATLVDHDLAPGGRVTYFITGPHGDKARGWWQVLTAEPPHRLEFEDGFADDDGAPDDAMPTMTWSSP